MKAKPPYKGTCRGKRLCAVTAHRSADGRVRLQTGWVVSLIRHCRMLWWGWGTPTMLRYPVFLILDIKLISVIIFTILLWALSVFCLNKKGGREASNGIRGMPEQKDLKCYRWQRCKRSFLWLCANSCSFHSDEQSMYQKRGLGHVWTFDLWTLTWEVSLLTKPLPSRRDYGTKSIIHGARAWSQLISVQSRRNRLKLIRRLPAQHLPEEDGSTFAVSQSFTVLQQHRCEAETDKSAINQHSIFIYLFKKKNLHWEYISCDNKNTLVYNFIFLARGVQEVIMYSISVLLLHICILQLIKKKSSLCIGCRIITRMRSAYNMVIVVHCECATPLSSTHPINFNRHFRH